MNTTVSGVASTARKVAVKNSLEPACGGLWPYGLNSTTLVIWLPFGHRAVAGGYGVGNGLVEECQRGRWGLGSLGHPLAGRGKHPFAQLDIGTGCEPALGEHEVFGVRVGSAVFVAVSRSSGGVERPDDRLCGRRCPDAPVQVGLWIRRTLARINNNKSLTARFESCR
ncbi:hypothetical protein [Azospirillum melinis]